MPKSNPIIDHAGVDKLLKDRADARRAQYLVPEFGEDGLPTGQQFDSRFGQQEGQPDPERYRAHVAMLNEKYGGYAPRQGQAVPGFQVADPFQSEGLFDSIGNVLKSSTNKSLGGALYGLGSEAITGEADTPFDLAGFQPTGFEDLSAEVLSFLNPVDIAALVGGGGLGGLALKTGGKKLAQKAISKKIAQGAGSLGAFEGLKTGVVERDVGAGIEAAGKGALTGAILGGVTGKIPATIAGSKVAGQATKFGAEVGTFGTVSPFLHEGRAPNVDDYTSAAAFLVGLKVSHGILGKLTGIGRAKEVAKTKNKLEKADDFNEAVADEMIVSGLTAKEVAEIRPATQAKPKAEAKPVEPPTVPKGKEPWEMTKEEWVEEQGNLVSGQSASKARALAKTLHRDHVKIWLREGKPVPESVLKDYPDLKPSQPRTATKPTVDTPKPTKQESLRLEREQIFKDIGNLGNRLNDITGITVEGSFLVGKLAVNYMKSGAMTLAEAIKRILKKYPNLTEKDVHKAIAGYRAEAARGLRTETPEALAKEFGLKYDGVQDVMGGKKTHNFTDPKSGGSTIQVFTDKLGDLAKKVAKKRAEVEENKDFDVEKLKADLRVKREKKAAEIKAERPTVIKTVNLEKELGAVDKGVVEGFSETLGKDTKASQASEVAVVRDEGGHITGILERHESKGKKPVTFLLTEAETVDDFRRLHTHVTAKKNKANLYIAKEFETSDVFRWMQDNHLITDKRIGGRYRVHLGENIAEITKQFTPVGRHQRGGITTEQAVARAKHSQGARLWGEEALERAKVAIKSGSPQFMHQVRNKLLSPVGEKFKASWEKVIGFANTYAGRSYEEAIVATGLLPVSKLGRRVGFKGMTEAEGITMGKMLSGEIPMNESAKAVRGVLERIWTDLKGAGLDHLGKLENYFPRFLKREIRNILYEDLTTLEREIGKLESKSDKAVAAMLRGKNEKTHQYIKFLQKELAKKVSEAEVRAGRELKLPKLKLTLAQIITQGRKEIGREQHSNILRTASFEHERRLGAPSEFYETDARIVIPEYIETASRRLAEAREWGVKSEKLIDMIRSLEETNPQEAALVKKLIGQYSGSYEVEHGPKGKYKEIVDKFVAFQVATKIMLGRAPMLQFGQWAISFLPDMGVFATTKGAINLLDASHRSALRTSGIIRRYSYSNAIGYKPGGRWGQVAERLGTLSGFTGLNKMLLYWSASSFDVAVRRGHKIAQGSGKRAEYWKNKLSEDFKMDWRKPINEQRMQEAMYKYATDSQLQQNLMTEPEWLNNPHTRALWLFKRFGVKQATFMKDMVLREAKRGNMMPIVRLAAAGYLGGGAVVWAVNAMREGLSGQPVYRKDDTFLEEMMTNISMLGAFGVVTDAFNVEKISSLPGAVKFALSPVLVSDAEKVLSTWTSVAKDWEKYGDGFLATRRNAYRVGQFFGSYPRYLSERTRTESQMTNREKFLKGKEKREIMELYLENNHKAISRRIEQFNKHYPNAALNMDDVDLKALEAYLKRRRTATIEAATKQGTKERRELKRKLKAEDRQKLKAIRAQR